MKWEGKAVAAQKQLENRAKVAEEAAAATKAVADDRLRALELGQERLETVAGGRGGGGGGGEARGGERSKPPR